jgi:predicted O-methyltransferase YrrM
MEVNKRILEKFNLVESKSPIILPISREELCNLFAELELNIGVEIGVERGYFAESMLKANPSLKLYGVDAWRAYKGYRDHTNQDKLERYYTETVERLKPYNCEIIRDWSVDASKRFADNSIDFVYIDGNHDFQNCTNDIAEWSKKVKPGGIIAGHDFVRGRTSCECQVKDVVTSWCYAYGIKPWFLTSDEFPSWFYAKV